MSKSKKRYDPRPLCKCKAYKFPHKANGGYCNCIEFLELYFYNDHSLCNGCNCFNEDQFICEAQYGIESINEAECFEERKHSFPSEYIPIKIEDFFN